MANPWDNDPVVGEEPWLNDPVIEDNYAARVFKALPAGMEASVRMIGSVPAALGGAIGGAGRAVIEGRPEAFQEHLQGALESPIANPLSMIPDITGKSGEATQAFMHGVEQVAEATGSGAVQLAKNANKTPLGVLAPNVAKALEIAPENAVRTGAEAGANLAINAIPFGEAKVAATLKRPFEKPPTVVDPLISKAQEIAEKAGRKTVTAEDIKLAENPWLVDPIQSEFPDAVMRGRQVEKAQADAQARLEASREMAQGDYQNAIESQAYLNLNRDLFNDPIAKDPLLGETTYGGRERIAPELGTGPEHIDPITMTPQREAPTMGTQPGAVEGFTKPLDLADRTQPSGAAVEWNVRDAEVPRNIGQGELPLEARPMEGVPYTKELFQPSETPHASVTALEASRAIAEKRQYLHSQIADKANSNDFRGTLETIRDNSLSPWEKILADTFLKDKAGNERLIVAPVITSEMLGQRIKAGEIVRGMHGKEGITLARDVGLNPVTVLHETAHSKTARLISLHERGMPLPNAVVADAIKTLDNLFEYVKGLGTLKGKYGMTDLHEFFSEGWTNPEFRSALADIRVDPKWKGGVLAKALHEAANIAGILLEQVRKIIGLPIKDRNALALLVNESDKLFKQIRDDGRVSNAAYGKLNFDNVALSLDNPNVFKQDVPPNKASVAKPESASEYKDNLATKEGEVFAKKWGDSLHKEYLKQWDLDNKPLPKPVGFDNRDLPAFKESLYRKDGSMRIDDIKIVRGFSVGHTAADTHPIIRQVYDAAAQATNKSDMLYNDLMRKATVVEKGAFNPAKGRFTGLATVERVEAADSVKALERKLKETDKDMLFDITNNNPRSIVQNEALLKAKGASPTLVRYMKAHVDMVESGLKQLNDARAKAGLAPVKDNPMFWASHSRYGAFHTYAIDKATGKSEFMAGFNSMAEAQKVADAQTQTTGTKHVAVARESNPRVVASPGEAFIEAIASVDDPGSKAMLKDALQRNLQKLGISRYALTRDSAAGGFAGSKELVNTLGTNNAFDGWFNAVDMYARSTAKYVADIDHAPRINTLLSDPQIKGDFPNATARANSMWADYKGEVDSITSIMRDASKLASSIASPVPVLGKHITEHTGERAIQGVGNFFTMNAIAMLNPMFYLANAITHMAVPAYMQRLNATTLGGKGNVAKASILGEGHMLFPRESSMKIFAEGMRNGSLEPRFIEAMDWMRSENAVASAVKYGTGERAAAWSDMYSRASAYAMMYEFGKSAGMNETKAHGFAAREAQGIMINHAKWARMPIINKLGPIGDAVAPLTSFVSNYTARLTDYVGAVAFKDRETARRQVAPLVTMLAAYTAVAGIKGLPFHDDIESVVLKFNEWATENMGWEFGSVPQDFIAKHVPEVLNNGMVSTALGVAAWGTLGAGTLIGGAGQTAGLGQAGAIIRAFYDFVTDKVTGGSVPDAQRVTDIKAVTPPMGKYVVDAMTSGKEGSIADKLTSATNVKDSKGDVTYTRSGEEQVKSTLLAKPSLKEAEEKKQKFIHQTKEASVKVAKAKAIEKLVDAAQSGKEPTAFTQKVFENYPEIFDGLNEAVEKEIINRNVPYKERALLKAKANDFAFKRYTEVYNK